MARDRRQGRLRHGWAVRRRGIETLTRFATREKAERVGAGRGSERRLVVLVFLVVFVVLRVFVLLLEDALEDLGHVLDGVVDGAGDEDGLLLLEGEDE